MNSNISSTLKFPEALLHWNSRGGWTDKLPIGLHTCVNSNISSTLKFPEALLHLNSQGGWTD